jgi:para-nitrobenzyl esterase
MNNRYGNREKRLIAFCLLVSAIVTAVPAVAQLNGPVKTQTGQVSGIPGTDPTITVFKGIPFAAPPVGELRWRPPQPPASWQGVRKAAAFGPSCIQNVVDARDPWTFEFMTHGEISEDCLYLNIWTSAKSGNEKLPVFVYIHGGGFTEGSGMVPVYDGEGLARKGLVMITINYRLGVFGLLAHPELTKESEHKSSGNYGMLDQIAALQWVQKNVAAFGGDPSRVTIAGQSAGAGSVHNLTASPLAKGLFQRGIAESGSSVARPGAAVVTLAAAEQNGVKFTESKGAKSLKEMRDMPWKDLMPAPGGRGAGAPRFGVNVDGWFLAESVADTIAHGNQNDVPFITGCNAGEGGATPHPDIKLDAFQKQAQQRYGDLSETFLKLYPVKTEADVAAAQNSSSHDQARTSMYLWAINRQKTAKTKVFTYFWEHPMPGPNKDKFGAFHTSEVPYVLNSLKKSDRPFEPADFKIADMLSSYWANFAKTGDPNGKGLAEWPAVNEKTAMTMELGNMPGPIPVAGDKAKLDFFRQAFSRPAPPQFGPPMP